MVIKKYISSENNAKGHLQKRVLYQLIEERRIRCRDRSAPDK